MRLSDIHARLERGDLVPLEMPHFAATAAISQLATFEGLSVRDLDFTAPEFARAYPPERRAWLEPLIAAKQYCRWRDTILDVQMQAAPGDTDADPWLSLKRAAKLGFGHHNMTGLYAAALREVLPPGTRPWDVTAELLAATLETVPQARQAPVRQRISCFRRLSKSSLCRATGLLPLHCLEAPPKAGQHARQAPMSPSIGTLHDSQTTDTARVALAYVNRLAILGGFLNGTDDTLEEFADALPFLPQEPIGALPPVKIRTHTKRLATAINVLGIPDPRLPFAEQAWHGLRIAAKGAGLSVDCVWVLARYAIAREIPPCGVTRREAWAFAAGFNDLEKRRRALIACEQIDAMRGVLPAHLLPPDPLDVCRKPVRARPPALPQDPAKEAAARAWKELYANLRSLGWQGRNAFQNLSAVRKCALDHGLGPMDITQSWVDLRLSTFPEAYKRRFRAAVTQIRHVQKTTDLELPVLEKCNKRASTIDDPIHPALKSRLEPLLTSMGTAPSTTRATRKAIRAVCLAAGDNMTLEDLLSVDPDTLFSPEPDDRTKAHAERFALFRKYCRLPWSPAWFRLQLKLVNAGIPRKQNPVPHLVARAAGEGLEPQDLDLSWAQRIDRSLRSTICNPPHGRADVAITFARKLRLLDDLHAHPVLAQSGLLPPVIGPIR